MHLIQTCQGGKKRGLWQDERRLQDLHESRGAVQPDAQTGEQAIGQEDPGLLQTPGAAPRSPDTPSRFLQLLLLSPLLDSSGRCKEEEEMDSSDAAGNR